MATLARLSHVGFNVPRDSFEKECDFWEKVIGLRRVHANDRAVFFTADPLRDHEFIIYAVDQPVAGYGQGGCMVNHVALDVATAAEVDELTARLRAHGYEVGCHRAAGARTKRQARRGFTLRSIPRRTPRRTCSRRGRVVGAQLNLVLIQPRVKLLRVLRCKVLLWNLFVSFLFTSLVQAQPQLKKIRMGISTTSIAFLSIYAAQLKGFYRDEGIDLELILMPATLASSAVLTGDIDYNGAVTGVIAAAVQGRPMKVLVDFHRGSFAPIHY